MRRGALGAVAGLAAAVAVWSLQVSIADPPRHGARVQTVASRFGLTLAAVRVDGRDQLVVTSLRSDSTATASGMRVGDVIEDVDGRAVASPGALDGMLAHAAGRGLAVEVGRGGEIVQVRLFAPSGETGVEQQVAGDRGRRRHG